MNVFAGQMRRSKTWAEQTAYSQLKDLFTTNGTGFTNQVVFGFYILDFVVPSKMLVIELDGASHTDRDEYDAKRDAFCRACGLTVVRLLNDNAHAVADAVAGKEYETNWLEKWARAKRIAAKAKASNKDVEVLAAQMPLRIKEESYMHLVQAPREIKKRKMKWSKVKPIQTYTPVDLSTLSPVLARRRAERLNAPIVDKPVLKPAPPKAKKRKGLSFSQSLASLTK